MLHDCPAVAVAVDDVAEYVQHVRIGEARLVKQGFEFVDGIAVKVGDGVGGHSVFSPLLVKKSFSSFFLERNLMLGCFDS